MPPRLTPLVLIISLGCGEDAPSEPEDVSELDGVVDQGGEPDLPDDPVLDMTPGAELMIEGLSARVEVFVDEHGITHISGHADEDCVAALGYLHASRRFFQMDMTRRQFRGQLAELFGTQFRDGDGAFRQYFSTPHGVPLDQALSERLDSDTQDLLLAYSSGVNAWLRDARSAQNGATWPAEYGHPAIAQGLVEAMADWDPLDSLASWVLLMFGNSDLPTEPLYGFTAAALPPELWYDLVPLRPEVESYTFDALRGNKSQQPTAVDLLPTLRLHHERLAGMRPALADLATHDRALRAPLERLGLPTGSNNWALSSAFTGGPAILANDPHGALSNPAYATPYIIDCVSQGDGSLHVGGMVIAGTPIFAVGFNSRLAWGGTVSYGDVTDFYLETPTEDGEGVIFRGEVVPFVEREDTIIVRGSAPHTVTQRWVPHHGPVVLDDEAQGLLVTRRWTGHAAPVDIEAFLALMRADGVDEALAGLATAEATGLNTVLADQTGRVAWHVTARVPNRPWASTELAPWLPLPGDGSAEWDGFVEMLDHPSLVDPPSGWVATANNAFSDAWADGDPTNDARPYLQAQTAPGYRHLRIAELLAMTLGAHGSQESLATQTETLSVPGSGIVPRLLEAADASPDPLAAATADLVEALRDWAFTCPTGLVGIETDSAPEPDPEVAREAIGCMAYHAAMVYVTRAAFRDEFEAFGQDSAFRVTSAELVLYRALVAPESLMSGDALWDDLGTDDIVETRDQTLLAGLDAAADFLVRQLGSEPDEWRWGRRHTVVLRGFYAEPEWSVGPYASDGATRSVNPGFFIYEESRFTQRVGPVMRLVVEMTAQGPVAVYQLPGGLEDDRDSPFYDNLLPLWLRKEPVPLHFERGDAIDHATELIVLDPSL